MAKAKRMYGCTECGATFPKWAGQCGECGAWNTLTETMIESGGAAAHTVVTARATIAADAVRNIRAGAAISAS